MVRSPRTSGCGDCGHRVPIGRWCNRCGAPLPSSTGAPARGRARVPVVVGVAALALVGALATTLSGRADDTAAPVDDPAVVLGADALTPPALAWTATPSESDAEPEAEVDVICSDLRIRSVPVDVVSTDEPGQLVDLAYGTCVVVGPNGLGTP